MADLNQVVARRVAQFTHTYGNTTTFEKLVYEAVAAAANDKIYLGKLPQGATILDLLLDFDDLGTGVTLDVGYEKVNAGDTLTADLDFWIDGQDVATAAGAARSTARVVTFAVDVWVVATVLGAAATGSIAVYPQGIYDGPPV